MSTGGAEIRFVYIDDGGDGAPSSEPRPGGASRARADLNREQREQRGGAFSDGRERQRRSADSLSLQRVSEKGASALGDFDALATKIGQLPVLGRIAQAGESIVRPTLATYETMLALRAWLQTPHGTAPGRINPADTRIDLPSRTQPIVPELVRETPPPLPRRREPVTYDIGNAAPRQPATPPPLPPIVSGRVSPPPLPPRLPAAPALVVPQVVPAAAATAAPVVAGAATNAPAATGVAAIPSVAGPLIAVGLAASGAALAIRTLMARANESANTLQGYSGILAAAKARQEALQTFQDVQRARTLGPSLARYTTAQGRLERALERIADVAAAEGLQRLVPALEQLAKLAERGSELSEKYGKNAGDAFVATLRAQFPGLALGLELLGLIAKNTEKTADAVAGVDDGFIDIFARPADLKPDDAGGDVGNIARRKFAAGALGPQLGVK